MPGSNADRKVLRIALLSDLHPTDSSSGNTSSFMDMNGSKLPEHCPIEGLRRLSQDENLSVDIVACAGDIGTKAEPKTITYGWECLNKVKDFMNADLLVAVPGNHDHDSRLLSNCYDPKYHLQSLKPDFPFDDHAKNTHFWAWHWESVNFENIRIIALNSSAYHGMNEEYTHGRVAPRTVDYLSRKLKEEGERELNILICHHHPQRQEDLVMLDDYDVMSGGDYLLQALGDGATGYWIILHGHRHFPKVSYAQGATSMAPIVFSAASFSGHLHPALSSHVKNQFHIIEIHLDKFESLGCVGTFNTWSWSSGRGWRTASDDEGLPASGGFGYRHPTPLLAKQVQKALGSSTYLTGDEIYKTIPELKYLTPKDLDALSYCLKSKHNIDILISNGLIDQLGAQTNG